MRRHRKLFCLSRVQHIKPSCPDTCLVVENKKGSISLLLGGMEVAASLHVGCYGFSTLESLGALLLLFFLLAKTEKRQRLRIKPVISAGTVETWLVVPQQAAAGLDRRAPAVHSLQSKLSAEI